MFVRVPLRALPDESARSAPPGPAPAIRPDALAGLRVLVVDDEEDSRAWLASLVQVGGGTAAVAGSGESALDVLAAGGVDLLLSDIGMPDVDGYELLRRIRTLRPSVGGHVPAIALTAFARSEDRTRALRAGFLAHVAKPVEPSELLATVASVVGRAGDQLAD